MENKLVIQREASENSKKMRDAHSSEVCKSVLDEHDGLPYVHVLQDFVFSISITFPEKYKIFRLTWKLLLTT